jgi:hypothetical protein
MRYLNPYFSVFDSNYSFIRIWTLVNELLLTFAKILIKNTDRLIIKIII